MQREYRPDIDGLRSIAVLAVVIFHAFPSVLQGGYVGVDIFFVISGFLIGGVVFKDSATERMSIRKFYIRRIRRIFPSLVTVLLTCLILGWFVLSPTDYRSLGRHVIGGSSFVSNLVLWRESGYFDTSAELKPLLHLWSLGVEEQFYIFFPIVILAIIKLGLHRRLVLRTLLLGSLVACVLLTSSAPSAAFYNPLTRVWEILIGVVIADITVTAKQREKDSAIKSSLSVFGLLLIGYAITTFDSQTSFPSWRALLPTVGAALLIFAGPSSVVNRKMLSQRPAIWIGLISYPLYLWHWPILVFLRIRIGHTPSAGLRIAAVAASLLAASLTFRFIERSIRFKLPGKQAIVSLLSSTCCVLILGTTVVTNNGFSSRFTGESGKLAVFKPDVFTDARLERCWIDQFKKPDAFASECYKHSTSKSNWLLWGDSHAARLYPGLKMNLPGNVELSQMTRSSCPSVLNLEFAECQASNNYVMSLIRAEPPETVILFGRWETYLNPKTYENFKNQFKMTIQELKKVGVKNIFVMGQAPFWSGSLPTNMLDLLKQSGQKVLPTRTDFRLTTIAVDTEKLFQRIVKPLHQIRYFSVVNSLCENRKCLVTVDGTVNGLSTWDYGHFTTPGASYVSERLLKFVSNH